MTHAKPTAAQLALHHGGVSAARGARNPRSAPRRMVDHVLTYETIGKGETACVTNATLQLPLYVQGPNHAAPRWSWGQNKQPKEQREMLWRCLTTQLRGLHTRVVAITFERLSTDDKGLDPKDNLPMAFKALCDGVCAWIVEGPEVFDASGQQNARVVRRVGTYDDLIIGTWRLPCHYEQQLLHHNHGVRIKLQLGASREPTPRP